ncbi:MAG: mechanosensitive ion channel family protein [Lachnospiraceae bacterium]|nr:mechanosensitive ion channel family protein [Lachnospiraceae bacterium]
MNTIIEYLKQLGTDVGLKIIFGILVLLIGFKVAKWLVKLVAKGKAFTKLDKSVQSFLLSFIKIILYSLVIASAAIIWGIPTGMAVLGLLLVLFSYAQPSRTATVAAVLDKTYTPARKMARGTAQAVYREELEVSFGDGETAVVTVSSVHPHELPKAGDEIQISRWFGGMVMHPNRLLVGIGGAGMVIGGLFLVMFLLTNWLTAVEERRKARNRKPGE